MRLKDRLARYEAAHPPPEDADARARHVAALIQAMHDTVGGPHPHTEAETAALVADIARRSLWN